MNRLMINTGIVWLPSIPSTWSICKVKNQFYLSKTKASDKNPVILSLARSAVKIRDISNNEGQLAQSYEGYNPVKFGDLLLNPMDLYSGANCNMSEVEGVISPAYSNLRATNKLNPKYYDFYFKTQYWTMAMFAHGKGVSFDNRWTLNSDGLLNYEIPAPPIEEQNIIVSFLGEKISKADQLIHNQENQIEKLKQYKQSLISEIVKKGLDPNVPMKDSGIDWIGEINQTYVITSLKNVVIIKTGTTPSSTTKEYFDGNINWYTPGDFVSDCIDKSQRTITDIALKENNIELYPVGTTLLIGIGGTAGKVTKITQAGYSNQQITALISKKCDFDYLFYYLKTIQKYIKDNAMFTTLPIINNSYLSSIKFVSPSILEQKRIVNYLNNKCSRIDTLIELKQQKIEKLNSYKKSLIYEYVTGKKEVN